MTSTESPAVARRRLRLALRKAREAKGYTQAEVADALEWSLSKINRIESGEVTISHTDLRALLDYLAITDKETVDRLAEDARAARRRGWWDDYRTSLNPATIQLLQFESEATVVRYFSPTLVPGIVQTRAYAESILSFWEDDMSQDDRQQRLAVRMSRRDHIFGRRNPPNYFVILDESVIFRQIGGARAMAEQLQMFLDLIEHHNLIVRIIPLAESGAGGMIGPFTVFDLENEDDAVLYRESHLTDEIVQSPEQVRRHRRIFQKLWEHALPEEATIRLITARSAAVLASLDRQSLHSQPAIPAPDMNLS